MLPIVSSDLTLLEYYLRSRYGNKKIAHDNDAVYERAMVKYNLANYSVFHSLDAAIADIEKYIENEPDREVGYRTRAEMLSMKLINLPDILENDRNRIIQRIRADYLRAREIEPANGWAWLGLIEASLLGQDWDEAISFYGESATYTKTQEQKLIRSLFGCVALVLAGESIDEEDIKPLYDAQFSREVKHKLKNAELGPRLAMLSYFVLNKLHDKQTWGKKWRVANDIVNKAIIEFDAWPKFLPFGYRVRYNHYERAIELRWVKEERVIELQKKAQAVKIHMSSRYSDGPQPAIKTLTTAMDFNDKALNANVDDASVWYERAIIFEGFGRNEEALKALERAGKLNTDPSGVGGRAMFMKARLLQEFKRYPDALKVYDEITSLVDADVSIQALAWIKKAEAFVELSQERGTGNQDGPEDNRVLREGALACLQRAITLQPDFVEAWVHKADILKDLERYEESLIAYARALEVRPYYAILSGNTIYASWKKAELLRNHFKTYEEAVEAYNAVLPFANDHGIYTVMMHKGTLLEELGHFEKCMEAYEKAAEYDLFSENIYHKKAIIFIKMGRYEDALCAFDKAIEISKSGKDMIVEWLRKAKLLERLSRFDEARQAYDIANHLRIEEGYRFYNLAHENGIKSESDLVLLYLLTAIRHDEKFKKQANTDTAFDFLRNDPDFQKILK